MYDHVAAAGSGTCKSYESWKPTPPPGAGHIIDGDLTFSFTNLWLVLKSRDSGVDAVPLI
jgi:hypothetical protein